MYNMFKKMTVGLAIGIMAISAAYASSWDEDNVPPAGSVVNSDYSPAPRQGFYLGIEGGGTLLNDQQYKDKETGFKPTIKSNPGVNGGITIGYDYKLLRIEEELNAAYNGADKATLSGFPSIGLDGHTASYSGMTNVMLNLRGDTGFGVFAGVGIGGSAINYNYQVAHTSGSSDSTWRGAFSGQALAGISYAFNPTVELDLEYRYLNAWVQGSNDGASIPNYSTNNVDLGLKFFLT